MAFDPSDTKVHKLIDLNLFSGSSDIFRTAVGGYWKINEEGAAGSSISFQTYDNTKPLFPYFSKIETNSALKETACEDMIITNKRFPVRVYGNGEMVSDDKLWKALFVGGQFGENKVNSVYNENIYGYHYFETSLPYTIRSASAIEGNSISDQIQISYGYNKYLPEYEEYIKNLSSELLIPNFYIISDLQSIEEMDDVNSENYDSDIINFATLDGKYPDINTVLNSTAKPYESSPAENSTFLTTEYLPTTFVQNPLSATTQDAIKNKLQNIILDEKSTTKLYTDDQILKYAESFPLYTKINFSLDKSTSVGWTGTYADAPFVDYITDNEYTTRFLKTLKEVFNNELGGLPPSEATYASNLSYLSSSEDNFVSYDMETTENKTYRYVDFIEMIARDYNNFISTTDNCYFVGDRDIYRNAAADANGAYRYMNSVSTVNTMNNIIDYLNKSSNFDINSLEDFLYQGAHSCYNETIAYRVQKVGGAPTGDAHTQDTLQNYWFINSKDLEEFNFIDTQVKYNSDYTYHVYKYVVVVGARYKFSDLRVTKEISNDNTIEDPSRGLIYGLEFYDPTTDEKVEQLFNVEADVSFPTLNSLGTLIQESTEYPYLADFYLNYEPCVFIYEVPVHSKTLKVVDNPANGTNVYPYQYMDASQRIGFELTYDTFIPKGFPKTITSADDKLKQDYLNARGLLTNEDVPFESIGRPRYIEVYRMNERPTAYSDFDTNLITTLDLRMPDSEETYTVDFFDDQVRRNTNYYYLFRILNEHRMIGHTSEIYEAQLVSDGGYLYAIFNVIYEEDLMPSTLANVSVPLKKIMQLQPNLSQLTFDTDSVDLTQEAHTQIGNLQIGLADDLIWDKKFKIRLTSKKTDRIIDLNITYKLGSG
jgi:hypothetical protein